MEKATKSIFEIIEIIGRLLIGGMVGYALVNNQPLWGIVGAILLLVMVIYDKKFEIINKK